jgi:precorrin-2 dehydrogenase/sirohydrochlorin ferrochelatase
MRYFPVFLDVKGKLCVVVGGGRVAERKVRSLLKAGARVKVIGPELTAPLSRLGERGAISCLSRPYRGGDLRGASLVIAATDDRPTNERVFRQARKQRVPVNVVDDPGHSSFIVPSVVEKKDLLIAISTSGQSPALARVLRQKFEREIGPEYTLLLKLLGTVRKKILSRGSKPGQNQRIFRQLVKEDLLSPIREKNFWKLDRGLKRVLGPGYSLRELGLRWGRSPLGLNASKNLR